MTFDELISVYILLVSSVLAELLDYCVNNRTLVATYDTTLLIFVR